MSQFKPTSFVRGRKPELYENVQLFFEDSQQTTGWWTGL